jgi:hypothetical protein
MQHNGLAWLGGALALLALAVLLGLLARAGG